MCNYVEYSSPLPPPFQYDDPYRGGICELADFCPFVQSFEDYVCVNPSSAHTVGEGSTQAGDYFGEDSRCIETRDSDGETKHGGLRQRQVRNIPRSAGHRCLRVRCVHGALQIRIGQTTEWLTCPLNGTSGTIDVNSSYVGQIRCPPAHEICLPSLEPGEEEEKEKR